MELDKNYEPNKVEKEIYSLWEKSGYFNPDKLTCLRRQEGKPACAGRPFCIIMPPPNANGSLHIGHAVGVTLEDIMIRYRRMKGDKTLWLPGADHAGFETQVVFEKKLEKEGTSRFEILNQPDGREKLYGMINEFTQANKARMENQLKQLGASCDWSREKFTLDNDIVKIVYETFKKLYDDGLVYRAKRIVNWCVKHQTSLSDLEVSWEEKNDKLYYVKYKILGGDEITVATTRPETIPGDVAIAVNPSDKRYKSLVGETAINPITGGHLKIIADEAVDMKFGTGALKITPAHDAADFEIGQRHKDEILQIIGPIGGGDIIVSAIGVRGYILPIKGIPRDLVGLKGLMAREKAIEILEKARAFSKPPEDYKHQVSVCYKCKNTIEPLALEQWFIDLTKGGKKKIVEPAIDAVKKGKIKIIPKSQEKIFFHWMNNIKDWNISRQIVWGIRIPAWQCSNCLKWTVTYGEKPKKCFHCSSKYLIQHADVFDTWFSSGQWPFATLMTARKNDFKNFYPTSVMETGYDILFFWIARMIMLSIYATGKIPFKMVYLHGLVRDKDRQKMSKSKGNVIDPLGVAEIYGTDALRMALTIGNTPGNDVVISEDKIRGYRNFATKIWNIGRFILMNQVQINPPKNLKPKFSAREKKHLAELKKIKAEITKDIENFKFYLAAETIYHYVWHTFADKIIEESKEALRDSASLEKRRAAYFLVETIFLECLKMLHPFMPYITEALYQEFRPEKILMIEKW